MMVVVMVVMMMVIVMIINIHGDGTGHFSNIVVPFG